MILKSIRWRLQIWYGLILVTVLVGFGVTAFQLERGRVLRRIDGELQRRANILGNVLRSQFRDARGEGMMGGPRGEFAPPRQRPGQPPEEEPEMFNGPPRELRLPPQVLALFDETDSNGFYYAIHLRDGRELTRSTHAPAELQFPPGNALAKRDNFAAPQRREGPAPARPEDSSAPPGDFTPEGPEGRDPAGPRPGRPREPELRMRGNYRELLLTTPPGEIILVGRTMSPEMKELSLIAFTLASVGGSILLLGLAGGWWIASRAIRPIKDISATATKISSGDLSQRIATSETESELGQLANVLNSTFARLEAAFRQQQQFASDAAHELRTPVSVMLTQTQSALNRERSAAEYRETVAACQRSAQRMRRLIESLLELARFDAGQEQLKRLKFDFAKTVRDCVEMIQPLADERSVKISTELSLVECTGDSERLGQVVTNLLTNAIQYNRCGGEVRIQLGSESGMAMLRVTDTGAGISAEDLPRVFERFYRADKARSGSGNAGLGLAICQAIVQAHGGTMEVTSEFGKGSTFIVRLPVG